MQICEMITLNGTLNEIRKQMRDINPLENDITILALQPGIGKSTFMKRYCNDHEEIFGIGIATKRHNFLKESERDINGFCHWYGFSKLCPKFEQTQKFHDLGVGASIICPAVCSKEEMRECEYRSQFKQWYRAGFPTEYLNTKYIEPFKMLFVEEEIYDFEIYQYDTENFIEGIKCFIEPQYQHRIETAIEEMDFNFFFKPIFSFSSNLKKEKEGKTTVIIEMLKNKQRTALRNAVKKYDTKTAKQILKFNADAVEKCIMHNTQYYTEPRMFKVFEIARRIPIVLNHATFDYNIFEKILIRYQKETKKKFKIQVYQSQYQNKKSTIYHYGKCAYSKNSINLEEIYDIVKSFYYKYGQKLGVITYKQIAVPLKKLLDIDAEHFGNTAGLNKFEGKKVLLVIGTPNIGHTNKVRLHNALFDDMVDEEYLVNEIQRNAVVYHEYPNYFDTKLWDISAIDELQMYDTLHRIRPLLKKKEIHLFGRIPSRICRELNVVECEKSDISFPSENQVEISQVIDRIEKLHKSGMTPHKIAIELGIKKKGSTRYDTTLVKKLIEDITKYKELSKSKL